MHKDIKYKEKPLITIITVVKNDQAGIEKTILSVINQSYPNIEYIIIDGQSNDETLNIIAKFNSFISTVISEHDKGVYDAMNKGIEHANGEWINFMNSGDSFYNNEVVSKLVSEIFISSQETDIILGSTNYVYEFGSIIRNSDFNVISKSLPACHQSIFIKTPILKKNIFNLNFKIAADYELIYRLFKQGFKFYETDVCVCNYVAYGGISTKNIMRYYCEYNQINQYNSKVNYLLFSIKVYFINLIKLILPNKIIKTIRAIRFYNRKKFYNMK